MDELKDIREKESEQEKRQSVIYRKKRAYRCKAAGSFCLVENRVEM